MRTLLRKIKFWKFKRMFGFVPARRSDGHLMVAEQRVVDTKLETLAANFSRAALDERAYSVAVKQSPLLEETLKFRERLLLYKQVVRRAKRDFWQAHGLARKSGFVVRPKHADYLPDPLL